MGRKRDSVMFEMVCTAATENALRLHLEGEDDDSAEWFPRSQLTTEINAKGDDGSVEMPQWLAREKGFE